MTGPAKLRNLLDAGELIVAPGAYDGITARLVEQAGFGAVYMTGSGTSQSLGFPDYGLLTMSEMADNAGILARSVSIPVIADADTGYGNELNVTRTVREYEIRGVAALQIEDQVSPKRCGHLDDKELVSTEDFIAKIRAAVAARRSSDFLVIARTDARAVHGLDEAVARANAALAAGADIAFVEGPQTLEEMAAIPRLVRGPCLLNVVQGGKTPEADLPAIAQMGYRVCIFPSLLLVAMIRAGDEALKKFRDTRTPPSAAEAPDVRQRFRRFGSDEWDAIRTKFRN